MAKDYALQIKVKNGRLLAAMREAGFANAAQLAKATGVDPSRVGEFLSLARPPISRRGLNPAVIKICSALKKSVEELWPEQHLETPLEVRRSEMFCDLGDVEKFIGYSDDGRFVEDMENRIDRKWKLKRLLPAVSGREMKVINSRFIDNKTLDDVGRELNVTGSRVREIECKGLRKMRTRAGSLWKKQSVEE